MLILATIQDRFSAYLAEIINRQLDRIERKLDSMRADLKKYFEDTKADYEAFGTALDNIDADLKSQDASIAALVAAQTASGELTDDEKTAMADLTKSQQALRSRLDAVAAEHPEAPPTPPAA